MHRRATAALLTAALAAVLTATGAGLPAQASPGDPVDPAAEARNFAKTQERASDYLTAENLAEQAQEGTGSFAGGLAEQAADPGRLFLTDLCWSKAQGCGGDPRLNDWDERGYGISRPVHFVARNGSTIAGHVWATRSGPDKRPLVVVTNGSVQASEELYWWAVQTLAKSGYTVLTWEPQGQGRSDTFGEGGDALDGVPSQSTGNTFYDHTQDALDFALSRPGTPYCPRPSRSGTSHCAKQRDRVDAGLATDHNPLWRMVDRHRIGLAGHSYGASGVSWVGQKDHRVDAVVAWDNLCDPAAATGTPGSGAAGCLPGALGPVRPRVPSLGLSADYGLTPEVKTTEPDPHAKSAGSRAFSRAGVDTGELVIRGGTHYEFSYIPTPTFGATLRGIDLAAWYTTAWMDRYVKGDRSALRRLLTDRWRHDGVGASVDPAGDGNLFSRYYRSRLDLGRDGGPRVRCENLRRGCADLRHRDGRPASYSYLAISTSPDR
jgi:alpha-beta hydrolase superfamily lysophospholipase